MKETPIIINAADLPKLNITTEGHIDMPGAIGAPDNTQVVNPNEYGKGGLITCFLGSMALQKILPDSGISSDVGFDRKREGKLILPKRSGQIVATLNDIPDVHVSNCFPSGKVHLNTRNTHVKVESSQIHFPSVCLRNSTLELIECPLVHFGMVHLINSKLIIGEGCTLYSSSVDYLVTIILEDGSQLSVAKDYKPLYSLRIVSTGPGNSSDLEMTTL